MNPVADADPTPANLTDDDGDDDADDDGSNTAGTNYATGMLPT